MPVNNDSKKILEQSLVHGSINTYILGCTDRRVTFNTQQTRAFNLVWALFDGGKIKRKSSVSVIGGGLAGMTAAAALNLMGCKVTLYHDKKTLMNIQKANIQRYIHPNIYDWPKAGCEDPHTDFPCMNWGAGTANQVFEQIEERWEDLSNGINVVTKHIDEVKKSGSKPRVYTKTPTFSEPYDCIVIAVGFGIEDGFPNTRYVSYWDPDDLDLIVKSKPSKHYLVSGCGDGGLIDALRIRISDFNHEEFTKSLLEAPGMDELKAKLIEIEDSAPEDEEEFGTYIYDAYKDLEIPSTLLESLSLRLRKDTSVELNGSKTSLMSPKACLINRFSIFLLIKLGDISYEQGKIQKVNNNGKKFIVGFKVGDTNMEREYDEVVVRHGPKVVIKNLLGTDFSLPEIKESEKITHKAWPEGFYPTIKEEINQMTAAYENLGKFRLKMNGIDRDADITIGLSGNKEIYIVRSARYLDDNLQKLTHFKGIEVECKPKDSFSMAYSKDIYDNKVDILSLGSRVFNEKGLSATLGCFVQLVDKRTAFLSSSHLFSEDRSTSLFFSSKYLPKTQIGTLLRKTKIKVSSDVRKQRNVVDAALILLEPNITYSRSATLTNEKRIIVQGLATAKIGDRVFKFGAGSGMTYGEVTGIHSSIIIEKNGLKFYFEDAIMIHSNNDEGFASSGDSGAMVFREDGRILGMIFATNSIAAVLCPIEAILKELQCSLLIY